MARPPPPSRTLIPSVQTNCSDRPLMAAGRSWTRIMLTRCQHLAGPAQFGAVPSSRGDRSLSTSALHRRPNRTCVIGEVPDQTSFDLAGDDWYASSRKGSRAWSLDVSDVASGDRPRHRGEVPERSVRRLHQRRAYPIDHTCAPRPDSQATPVPRVNFEHESTRGEVSERSIEAVLKTAGPRGPVGSNPTLSARS